VWTELHQEQGRTALSSLHEMRYFVSDPLIGFKTRAAQRQVVSKIEAKFCHFLPLQKLGEGWAKLLSGRFEFTLRLNHWNTLASSPPTCAIQDRGAGVQGTARPPACVSCVCHWTPTTAFVGHRHVPSHGAL